MVICRSEFGEIKLAGLVWLASNRSMPVHALTRQARVRRLNAISETSVWIRHLKRAFESSIWREHLKRASESLLNTVRLKTIANSFRLTPCTLMDSIRRSLTVRLWTHRQNLTVRLIANEILWLDSELTIQRRQLDGVSVFVVRIQIEQYKIRY